jgi:hypothetical protein
MMKTKAGHEEGRSTVAFVFFFQFFLCEIGSFVDAPHKKKSECVV